MITNFDKYINEAKIVNTKSPRDIAITITKYIEKDFLDINISCLDDDSLEFFKKYYNKYRDYEYGRYDFMLKCWIKKIQSLYFQAYILLKDPFIYLNYRKDSNNFYFEINFKDLDSNLPKDLELDSIYKFIKDNITNKLIIDFLLENNIYNLIDNQEVKDLLNVYKNSKNFDLI